MIKLIKNTILNYYNTLLYESAGIVPEFKKLSNYIINLILQTVQKYDDILDNDDLFDYLMDDNLNLCVYDTLDRLDDYFGECGVTFLINFKSLGLLKPKGYNNYATLMLRYNGINELLNLLSNSQKLLEYNNIGDLLKYVNEQLLQKRIIGNIYDILTIDSYYKSNRVLSEPVNTRTSLKIIVTLISALLELHNILLIYVDLLLSVNLNDVDIIIRFAYLDSNTGGLQYPTSGIPMIAVNANKFNIKINEEYNYNGILETLLHELKHTLEGIYGMKHQYQYDAVEQGISENSDIYLLFYAFSPNEIDARRTSILTKLKMIPELYFNQFDIFIPFISKETFNNNIAEIIPDIKKYMIKFLRSKDIMQDDMIDMQLDKMVEDILWIKESGETWDKLENIFTELYNYWNNNKHIKWLKPGNYETYPKDIYKRFLDIYKKKMKKTAKYLYMLLLELFNDGTIENIIKKLYNNTIKLYKKEGVNTYLQNHINLNNKDYIKDILKSLDIFYRIFQQITNNDLENINNAIEIIRLIDKNK